MHIRPAQLDELSAIQAIYDHGRSFMRSHGNDVQWVNGYPSDELLQDDIEHGNLYVVADDGGPHAVFAFIRGDDPTYAVIEDGAWLNDEPYGTIHRIASDGTVRGVMQQAVDFCLQHTENLRVDTHESNTAMQGAVTKAGFTRCGIITIADGTKRIAYQLVAR